MDNKEILRRKIEEMKMAEELLDSADVKRFLRMMDSFILIKERNLSRHFDRQDPERDDRLRGIAGAELRGMKVMRYLADHIIIKGQQAQIKLDELHKEAENAERHLESRKPR